MNEALLFCGAVTSSGGGAIIAITLCEASVRTLSKQELEVKGVSHKVYEREIECIGARKIGRTH